MRRTVVEKNRRVIWEVMLGELGLMNGSLVVAEEVVWESKALVRSSVPVGEELPLANPGTADYASHVTVTTE